MNRKEFYWFIGTIGLVLIIILVLFGIDGFNSDSTFDINIHDTYFVIAKIQIVPIIVVFAFFIVYLIRSIRGKFNNKTVNVILIIALILLSILISKINAIVDNFIQQSSGWTIYPPLLAEEKELIKKQSGRTPNMINYIFLAIQITLLTLLTYCGFKIGVNYKLKEK